MKKRITSVLALMLALTMVIGSSLTVCAYNDGVVHHENEGNGSGPGECGGIPGDSGSSGSSSSSSSESSGSSDGGGSYNSGSSYDAGASYDAGSGSSSSGSGTSSSAPAPKAAGSKATAGKQEFRAVANAGAGTYKVIHCGSEKMTFTLKGADGKAAACDGVALKKLDNGKYAINYTVKDAKDMTVGAPLDRTYMYDTLGVSYVTINDTVIIDIEAEAAAAKAAK